MVWVLGSFMKIKKILHLCNKLGTFKRWLRTILVLGTFIVRLLSIVLELFHSLHMGANFLKYWLKLYILVIDLSNNWAKLVNSPLEVVYLLLESPIFLSLMQTRPLCRYLISKLHLLLSTQIFSPKLSLPLLYLLVRFIKVLLGILLFPTSLL